MKKVQVRPNVFISLTLQVLTTELASNVRELRADISSGLKGDIWRIVEAWWAFTGKGVGLNVKFVHDPGSHIHLPSGKETTGMSVYIPLYEHFADENNLPVLVW